ncbi:hypothetical protein CMUS01_10915 [Colletotrichum musicola]|uniref:Uncharacterized protein n=1 Tax=Colletotrichum musicola TaxID=2175873 RepID=A0A8H6K1B1_9PEZI|nr:hypothetical protein CMUS01_10915 [Colletotrichum musicola]
MRVRLFHLLSPLLLSSGAACQGCFFPDGSPDSKGKQCFDPPDGKASSCCFDNHYCLDNGLCLEPFKYTLYRSSCTDAAYRADGCPTMCRNYSSDAHRGIWPCKGGDLWTCEDSSQLCNISTFRMGNPGKIILNTVAKSGLVVDFSSSNSSNSNPGVSVGAAAGIGAGVGVPLLIIVGILTILLLRERKKSRGSSPTSTYVAPETQSSKPGTTMSSPGWHHHQPARGYGEGTTELATGERHELPQY